MVKKRLAVALATCLLSISTGAAGASAVAKSPLSLRFTLSTTTDKAGRPIKGIVTITNSSSKTLLVETCAINGWLWVGLANKTTPFEPASTSVACFPSVKIKPGPNRFPVTVMTEYQMCEKHGTPRCPNHGMPSLPKGTYRTDVVAVGLPKGTPVLTHLRVTLT
jgi:hypothetical protein